MRDMEEKTALVVEDHSKHYKRYAALLLGMDLRVGRSEGYNFRHSLGLHFRRRFGIIRT